jgi:hypothetical protein
MPTLEQVKRNVNSGIQSREACSDARCTAVFQKFADPSKRLLGRGQLWDALKELMPAVPDFRLNDLIKQDICSTQNGLDLDGFKTLLSHQHPIEQWAETIPFSRMLADAISMDSDTDQLTLVANLSREDISIIVDGLSEGLKAALEQHVLLLSQGLKSAEAAEHSEGSKFQIIPMNCGRLTDFFQGLEGRLGE